MKTPAWVIFVCIFAFFIILLLVFKLYTCGKTIDDFVIVLIEQTWMLQLIMLKTYGGKTLAANWPEDALSIKGPKGELIVRRFSLLREWANNFKGVPSDPQLKHISIRIDEIDSELQKYWINLKSITALTLKMMSDVYTGDLESSSRTTASIVQRLRLI
jgi:hypothetical protein